MALERYVFSVLDDPHVVVDHDLARRNRRFLAGIDPGYFAYVLSVHDAQLRGSEQQRAAIALRTAYHHGVETLFTLLGAYIQAPMAVAAWIPRSSTGDLREIARRLQYGATLVSPTGPVQLMFGDLSASVHESAWDSDPDRATTVAEFGKLWSRFAADLLDTHQQDEYNSIKHGFRVRAGGFTLRVGEQEQYGVPAPAEAMRTIGSSVFGTSFFVLESRDGSRARRSALESRIRHLSLNWLTERLTLGLPLLGMSINNVVSKLRLMSGEQADGLAIQCPTQRDAYLGPWRHTPGVTSSNMDLDVPWDDVPAASRESLRAELGIPADGSDARSLRCRGSGSRE